MSDYLIVGRIGSPYGVKGWVKIYSFTQPMGNILNYDPWYINRGGKWQPLERISGKPHGKGIVAQLKGIDDRDAAAQMQGVDIAIKRDQLPETEADDFYWAELIGLEVTTESGQRLGKVVRLMETGANDVLVVKGSEEILIPFVLGYYVLDVDLDSQVITVDWEHED